MESVFDFLNGFNDDIYKISGKMDRNDRIIILDSVRKGYVYTYDEITYKMTDVGKNFMDIENVRRNDYAKIQEETHA